MKVLKVYYDESTGFIVDLVDKLNLKCIVEKYNIKSRKEKKKSYEVLTRYGTKKVPLIVFEDENLIEFSAIWSESNPNWENEILKIINE